MHEPRLSVFRAGTQADFEAIGALRYKAYMHEGLIDPNASGLFIDRYDTVSRAQVYGVLMNGRLVSSMRLHILDKSYACSATYTAFEDLLKPLLSRGLLLIDGARFVVDPDVSHHRLAIARRTLEIAGDVAETEFADFGVAAVQPKHAEFYRRSAGFAVLSGPRPYCKLKTPLILMGVDLHAARDGSLEAQIA